MTHSKYTILLLLLAVNLVSCKKSFLEVTDNSLLNRQGYIKNLSTMQEFVNGIYVLLSTKYESSTNEAYLGLISDELKVASEDVPLALHNNWSQVVDAETSSSTTSMNSLWMSGYQIIRSCNYVIQEIDKYSSENAGRSKNLKGQAYAIRALVHFRLLNSFSQSYSFTSGATHPGIPYITSSDITNNYSRQTVSEVYTSLINDLQSAIQLMPAETSDCRVMNAASAKALLARVYLFKEDYNAARTISMELAKQYPLMTISAGYPVDIFKNKNPSQTEVFFQVTPISQDDAVSTYIGIYLLYDYYRGTQDISTLLTENPNDIRSTWVFNTGSSWMVTKFPLDAAGGLGYHPSIDYYPPILRSSEVFLTAAESCAKTNDEPNARLYLNAIRKRADPAIADITATGQALIDSIYKERRKELCFEGIRMWDLQRTKQEVKRTDVLPGYQTLLPYPSNKAIAPIPGQDVKLMGLSQNPGYN